jgi:putative sigma-54 modulation protein
MDIHINGKHHEAIDDKLTQYTHKKLEKLSCYKDIISDICISYSTDHIKKIAEAKINITGGQLVSHAESKTMSGAMDLLIDKMIRQVIKHKEKHSNIKI